jgi:hypothetical protein
LDQQVSENYTQELVMPIFEPKQGCIRIGGPDYTELSLHAIQPGSGSFCDLIYSRPIQENIRYGVWVLKMKKSKKLLELREPMILSFSLVRGIMKRSVKEATFYP